MKSKSKFLALILLLISLNLQAQQNEGIHFYKGSVEDLYATAQAEGKPIYVDVMASWCGPCKWMARNVFTNKKVATYYNANFINYSLDIQKGEGVDFANKFRISLLPTHLFLYPDGKEFSRYLGAMNKSEFYLFGEGIVHDIGPIQPQDVLKNQKAGSE